MFELSPEFCRIPSYATAVPFRVPEWLYWHRHSIIRVSPTLMRDPFTAGAAACVPGQHLQSFNSRDALTSTMPDAHVPPLNGIAVVATTALPTT